MVVVLPSCCFVGGTCRLTVCLMFSLGSCVLLGFLSWFGGFALWMLGYLCVSCVVFCWLFVLLLVCIEFFAFWYFCVVQLFSVA